MQPLPNLSEDTAEDTVDDPAERRARHLAALRELADYTMDLARRAAAKAAAQLDADISEPNAPNHAQTFARLAREARQNLAQENRVAQGAPETASDRAAKFRPHPSQTAILADPRRNPLRHTLYRATKDAPDRARLRRQLDARIDNDLREDPAQNIRPNTLLNGICRDYQIHIDIAHVPDEILGAPKRVQDPPPGAYRPNAEPGVELTDIRPGNFYPADFTPAASSPALNASSYPRINTS